MLSLLLVVPPAHADFNRGSQTLSVFGGLGATSTEYDLFPGGGTHRIADPGNAYGGQYLYYISNTPALAFGIDVSGTNLGTLRTNNLVLGADSSAFLHSRAIQLIERLAFPSGRFRPYIFGGVGVHHTRVSLTAKPQPGLTWRDTGTTESRTFIDDSAGGLMVSWGVGLDIFLNENIFLGPEYRGQSLGHTKFNESPQADALGLNTNLDGIMLSNLFFRLGVKFGA